jgi:3D (Asp-Asp-Asp) domain-containing protein/septal ring factor EnvC (AmiA/AmiB activator)
MRGRFHRVSRRILVPLVGLLLLLATPATGPAQAPGIGALRQKSAELTAQSRRALVELYGLESRLTQARTALARVDAREAELARRQTSARLRHQAAQQTLRIAQIRLGRQLRLLYQQDQPDAIAVVLGATSLDDAIEGLENINRAARATNDVIEQSQTARRLVEQTRKVLAAEVGKTQAARARLAATTADLVQARTDRSNYLGRLRQEQALTASQISSLEQRAQEAQQKAAQITQRAAVRAQPAATSNRPDATEQAPSEVTQAALPDEPVSPTEPPPAPVDSVSEGEAAPAASAPGPPRPGGTMTVRATGYCMRGTTATGLPVGPGIVAVDPAVIPLGTRMTIPGYGEGVAADVGGAIKGARIDVWIAACAQAAAFTRTVTITFH